MSDEMTPRQPFVPQQKRAPSVEQRPPSPEQLEALWEETPAMDFDVNALREGLSVVLNDAVLNSNQ
ncbi:MAG: hypothetical protein FWE61_09045 [Micrococcales bacterium]|nr:hypothetical protein [Micrococcales bacterium]